MTWTDKRQGNFYDVDRQRKGNCMTWTEDRQKTGKLHDVDRQWTGKLL